MCSHFCSVSVWISSDGNPSIQSLFYCLLCWRYSCEQCAVPCPHRPCIPARKTAASAMVQGDEIGKEWPEEVFGNGWRHFWLSYWGRGCFWYLMNRGQLNILQRTGILPCTTQTKNYWAFNVSRVQAENLCSKWPWKPQGQGVMFGPIRM